MLKIIKPDSWNGEESQITEEKLNKNVKTEMVKVWNEKKKRREKWKKELNKESKAWRQRRIAEGIILKEINVDINASWNWEKKNKDFKRHETKKLLFNMAVWSRQFALCEITEEYRQEKKKLNFGAGKTKNFKKKKYKNKKRITFERWR